MNTIQIIVVKKFLNRTYFLRTHFPILIMLKLTKRANCNGRTDFNHIKDFAYKNEINVMRMYLKTTLVASL